MHERARREPDYRGTDRRGRVSSCSLGLEELRRIYRLLQQQNDQLVPEITSSITPEEGQTDIELRERVRENLRVTVVARGADGEQVVTHDISGLDESNLPPVLSELMIDSAWAARMVLGGRNPLNWCQVTLDFTRTPLIDLSSPSGEETRNASYYQVVGANSTWAAATHQGLIRELELRRLWTGWLHGARTYDLLLMLLLLPMALWGTWRLSTVLKWNVILDVGVGIIVNVYVFLLLVTVLRAIFGIARWLWPYVELRREGQGRRAFVARTAIVAFVTGIIYQFAVDMLRVLVGS